MGLFAPHNALSFAALLLCALSLSGAIALIVDMDTPFAGLIVVSPEPMQAALAQINSPQEESRACGANVSFPAIE